MLIGLQNNPVLIATDPATDDSYGYCVSLAKNVFVTALLSNNKNDRWFWTSKFAWCN